MCGMTAPGCRRHNALLLNLLLLCVTLTPQFIASPPEAESVASQALGRAVDGAQSHLIHQGTDDVSKDHPELIPSAALQPAQDPGPSSEVSAEPARKAASSPISSAGVVQTVTPAGAVTEVSDKHQSIAPIDGTSETPASRLIGHAVNISNKLGTEVDSGPKPGALLVPVGDVKPEQLQQVCDCKIPALLCNCALKPSGPFCKLLLDMI